MNSLVAIGKAIENISLHYPLGPIIVLASLYLIFDGYRTSSGAQMFVAALALLWSVFSLFTFIVQ